MVFQRIMENLLQGLIKHVCVYLDDVLVTGSSERDDLDNLVPDRILKRL